MAWTTHIDSDFVHVHDKNRDGFGCSSSDVHALCDDILDIGFNPLEPKPICAELSPADSVRIQSFNEKLARNANDTCPRAPIQQGSVKFGSLASSHLNQVLRLFKSCSKHDESKHPSLCQNGHLNPDSLKHHDKDFYEAVNRGLQWLVISNEVLHAFPILGQLIQESSNTANQLARREGELQLSRRIFNLWKDTQSSNPSTSLTFNDMREQILRSRPAAAPSAPYLFAFVMKFGGGDSAVLLNETEEHVKANTSSQRFLGPQIWDLVSQNFKGAQHVVRVRHAFIRLAYISDEKLITAGDVRKLFGQSNMKQLVYAEDLMNEIRGLSHWNSLTPEFLKMVFDWEHEAVKILLGKKDSADCLERALQCQILKIHEAGGPLLSDRWVEFGSAETSAKDQPQVPNASSKSTVILVFRFCCKGKQYTLQKYSAKDAQSHRIMFYMKVHINDMIYDMYISSIMMERRETYDTKLERLGLIY